MRAIIPIFVESEDLLLNTKSEVDIFFDETNPEDSLYQRIVASGDARMFYFGYANRKKEEFFKQKESALLLLENSGNVVYPGKVSLDTSLKVYTCAGEYQIKDEFITKNPDVIGYHRQKTRIAINRNLIINSGETRLSYLTIVDKGGENIIIDGESTLILNNVILDHVSIEVRGSATVILNNVSFKGGESSIKQREKGKIVKDGTISFDGVTYEYDFETLSKKTSENILDFSTPQAIKIFLFKSKVTNLIIYDNLDFKGEGDMLFKTIINFDVDENTKGLKIIFGKVHLKTNFSISEKIETEGDFYLLDANEVDITIGNLFGSINLKESKRISLLNSFIVPSKESAVKSDFSTLFVFNSVVDGRELGSGQRSKISFELLGSDVFIQQSEIKNLEKIIGISKVERNEDRDDEVVNQNKIIVKNTTFKDVREIVCSQTPSVALLHISDNSKIENVDKCFDLRNTEVNIEETTFYDITSEIGRFLNSKFFFNKSKIQKVSKGFEILSGCFAEVTDVSITDSVNGYPMFTLAESLLIGHRVEFLRIQSAVHARKHGQYVNDECSFLDVDSRYEKEHGAPPVLTYNEWKSQIEGDS